MQFVLAIPPGKGTCDIYALARTFPLDQRRYRWAAGAGRLELFSEVIVVGGGGAEHRGPAWQHALGVALLDGAPYLLGRDDGRAGRVHLLLDGQRQAGWAAELRRGNVVLRGIGGVYRGQPLGQLITQDGRHVDRQRWRGRGRPLRFRHGLLHRFRYGGIEGCGGGGRALRRGEVAGGLFPRRRQLLLVLVAALVAALLIAHGVAVYVVAVAAAAATVVVVVVVVVLLGGAQLAGDSAGASSHRLRSSTRKRAGRRGMALSVLEAHGRGGGGFGGAQRLN